MHTTGWGGCTSCTPKQRFESFNLKLVSSPLDFKQLWIYKNDIDKNRKLDISFTCRRSRRLLSFSFFCKSRSAGKRQSSGRSQRSGSGDNPETRMGLNRMEVGNANSADRTNWTSQESGKMTWHCNLLDQKGQKYSDFSMQKFGERPFDRIPCIVIPCSLIGKMSFRDLWSRYRFFCQTNDFSRSDVPREKKSSFQNIKI